MNREELIAFEEEVGRRFDAGEIPGPIHMNSETQADALIEIFKKIPREAWVLSTWRSHWHALLHGVPKQMVMNEIIAGRSMMLHFPEYKFMTSAIMGGMLPIACGLAAGGEEVFCFVGDMCATTGAFADAKQYILCNRLSVELIVEDNGLSTNTPTLAAWGPFAGEFQLATYKYQRTTNHYGTKSFVSF